MSFRVGCATITREADFPNVPDEHIGYIFSEKSSFCFRNKSIDLADRTRSAMELCVYGSEFGCNRLLRIFELIHAEIPRMGELISQAR